MLGNVRGITQSGELLVMIEHLPEMYAKVFDRRKKEVGKVVYIFGNIRSPYALVRPFRKDTLMQMMGKETYLR